jgi:hypothetical protein
MLSDQDREYGTFALMYGSNLAACIAPRGEVLCITWGTRFDF